MTLLDTLRDRARPQDPAHRPGGAPGTFEWWSAPSAGALAAAGTWLLLALPTLVVWVATSHTTVSWGEALGVASAGWFLGHGTHLIVDEVPIGLAPLGVWLLALVLSVRGAGRLLDRTERAAPGTTWPALLLPRLVPGFLLGYAGVAVVAWLFTLAAVARPNLFGLPLVLLVPALAMAWVLLGRYLADEDTGPIGGWLDRLPWWLPRAIRPGVYGAAAALGAGTLLVLVMVVVRWSTVSGLNASVNAGVVGTVVLTLGQLLVLPNLAVWALAWMSGTGVQIADGSSITLAGAHPGLMPMVPALGALPTDGTWSSWLLLFLAGPVLVGSGIGWLACRTQARLASWRTKLFAAGTAALTGALALTLVAALGSGAAGVDRLRAVGTRPLLFGAEVLGELLLGAALYVLADQLRLRFRPHR